MVDQAQSVRSKWNRSHFPSYILFLPWVENFHEKNEKNSCLHVGSWTCRRRTTPIWKDSCDQLVLGKNSLADETARVDQLSIKFFRKNNEFFIIFCFVHKKILKNLIKMLIDCIEFLGFRFLYTRYVQNSEHFLNIFDDLWLGIDQRSVQDQENVTIFNFIYRHHNQQQHHHHCFIYFSSLFIHLPPPPPPPDVFDQNNFGVKFRIRLKALSPISGGLIHQKFGFLLRWWKHRE